MGLKKGDRVEWCGYQPVPSVRLVGTVVSYIETDWRSPGIEVLWDHTPRDTRMELWFDIRLITLLDKIVEALDA